MKDIHVLTADAIAAMEGTAKTHSPNDRARRVNKSLGDATGLSGIGVHLIEVSPGDLTTEHHVHYHEDECVYVLSGTATMVIGDAQIPIGPGDVIGHPKGGAAHHIENTGTEPFRALVIGERAAHDVGDYPRLGKRIFRSAGLPWTVADMDDLTFPIAGKK
ncbi:Cupin domain protein [Rhodobacteraceae bacterium THAF1]|uniref:cupin domain-containing protein n=1 Tax=Palleronia sp. THAF1 TaxID=2587842 RepID=UPI000F3F2580|nr:cupin domain-containing protein [Palleronia sp. THAF1]QFU07252.1 Cupin domain protein [Palleronia sp. THAF1]VDC20836.1 Cupin domain protein [Rhodobacteraceae bacterium THAF1]